MTDQTYPVNKGVVMEQQFFIPFKLPGLNEVINASKRFDRATGKNRYWGMKIEIEEKIRWMIHIAHLRPVKRARIEFVWIEPNRRRDPDNISGGGRKFILDALVDCGILEADRQEQVLSLHDREFKVDKETPGVRVVIHGVGGG